MLKMVRWMVAQISACEVATRAVRSNADHIIGFTDREFTKVARMPPSLLGGGMASGGLGAAAPNTIIPLGMPRSLLRGGLLGARGKKTRLLYVWASDAPRKHAGRWRIM